MPRLAVAQIRPSKGEYAANLQKIGGVLAEIAKLDPPVDLVILPETATSGYFVEGGVRDVAVTAGTLFRDLTIEHEAAGAPPIDVAVGFYEVFQNHFYNSCLYASLGDAAAGERGAVGADPQGHHGRARRVGRVREPGGVRRGEGIPGRLRDREPGRRDRAARAAVRRGGAHLRPRFRRDHAGARGVAASSRPGGQSPASDQKPRETGNGKRETESNAPAIRPRYRRCQRFPFPASRFPDSCGREGCGGRR